MKEIQWISLTSSEYNPKRLQALYITNHQLLLTQSGITIPSLLCDLLTSCHYLTCILNITTRKQSPDVRSSLFSRFKYQYLAPKESNVIFLHTNKNDLQLDMRKKKILFYVCAQIYKFCEISHQKRNQYNLRQRAA